MHRAIIIALGLAAAIASLASRPASADEKLKVVASFSVVGDFAKNVGGDRVEVTTLVGPNGDAHVYEPTPSDAVAMAAADVVVVNGLHFEGFIGRLVDASATKAVVIVATRGVAPLKVGDEAHPHAEEGAALDSGAIDPHAFQSIANAKIYVKNIAEGFCAVDEEGCETYRANAAAYTARLDAAEVEVKAAIASIPEDKRIVITTHDAFGYFEKAYGVAFLAPEGISTESEPSAADVAALVMQVRKDKAAAIFLENISNPRLIEQIASETGIKIGGMLYSDALSGASEPGSTYIGMMRHNVETLRGAILGS